MFGIEFKNLEHLQTMLKRSGKLRKAIKININVFAIFSTLENTACKSYPRNRFTRGFI